MSPLANLKADARWGICEVHLARVGLYIPHFHLLESYYKCQTVAVPSQFNLSTSQEPLTVLFVAITALESHVITSWCTSLLCSTVTKWVYDCCPWICQTSLASGQTLDLTWKNINLHRILANWRKGLRKSKKKKIVHQCQQRGCWASDLSLNWI